MKAFSVLSNISITGIRNIGRTSNIYNSGNKLSTFKVNLSLSNIGLQSAMYARFSSQHAAQDLVFRQLFEGRSYTFTYLLADKDSKDAILIDPVIDTAERDVKILQELGLNLIYAANTHVHADHITGTGRIKQLVPQCKSIISKASKAKADVTVAEGDKVKFGKFEIEVKNTPGHTNGCLTFVFHEKQMAFTGDALLIRGCGRTDFQEGDSGTLYKSVHGKILSLPEQYTLFPAHDYTGQTSTTVWEEKQYNPRLSQTQDQFIEIMKKLNLPYPKQIDRALPANLVCGLYNLPEEYDNLINKK